MNNDNYIPYNPMGDYAGADDLLKKEWAYLKDNREGFDPHNIKGVALSGGGIRSASFCLGVMQALAANSKLRKFDYLSTVSGGGYLGGALSWLWSGLWKDENSQSPSFGVSKDDFPFGTQRRKFDGTDQDKDNNRRQASLLRHLRQHGKYLTPGNGITGLSLFSIVLRSLAMGFVTLMVLSGFVFSLFYLLDIFKADTSTSVFFRDAAGITILVGYVGLQIVYMGYIAFQKSSHNSTKSYVARRLFEKWIPLPLKIALICYVLAAIHWVQVSFSELIIETGSVFAAVGALLGYIGAKPKSNKLLDFIPKNIKLVLGAILMMVGLLALADHSVSALVITFPTIYIAFTAGAALLVIVLAYFLPINYISIHRYYRDRLMETFMPNAEKIFKGDDACAATKANATGLHDLALGEHKQAPYHLINTNAILVESSVAKFRGRGGDNFILSPLFSGSNATGWRNSNEFCSGSVTLPTAAAISGAAANPDAGVAGRGITTNAMISILMSLFNLRLGYWTRNPDPHRENHHPSTPNYLNPGFVEAFQRNSMNEQAPFVQLSDGGHFENLALYELFRRRARLILVCDAGEDGDYLFGDLANALEKARVDFGVSVDLDKEKLQKLIPATKPAQTEMDYPVAEQSYLIANVDYQDGNPTPAKLIYIKTTLSNKVSADVHGYKRENPDFPDQSTVDQFFDEVQFEAYRELGWQITENMLDDDEVKKVL